MLSEVNKLPLELGCQLEEINKFINRTEKIYFFFLREHNLWVKNICKLSNQCVLKQSTLAHNCFEFK